MENNNFKKNEKVVSVHLKIEQWNRLKALAKADGRCVYRQAEYLLGLMLKCGYVDSPPSHKADFTGSGAESENKF